MSYHTHFLTPSHIYNLVLETKTNLVKYFCLCPHLMYKHKCRNKIFSTKHSWKERISGMEGSINILRVSKWLSFYGWHQKNLFQNAPNFTILEKSFLVMWQAGTEFLAFFKGRIFGRKKKARFHQLYQGQKEMWLWKVCHFLPAFKLLNSALKA